MPKLCALSDRAEEYTDCTYAEESYYPTHNVTKC